MTHTSQTELNYLETTGLIQVAQQEPDLEYLFRHALIQDAAYDSLLKTDRRTLHAVVGKTLEEIYKGQDDVAASLAYHFELSEQFEKAFQYFIRAAEVAARAYANHEAAALYQNALNLIDQLKKTLSPEQIRSLYLNYGRVLELCGEHQNAFELYRQAQIRAEGLNDDLMMLNALIAQATLQATPNPMMNPPEAIALCDIAAALANKLDNKEMVSRVLWLRSLANFFNGNSKESVDYGEQALAIARAINHRERMAFALNDLSRSYWLTGEHEKAIQANLEAQQLWRELGNLPMLSDALISLAENNAVNGDVFESLRLLEQALEISAKSNNYWGQCYAGTLKYQILQEMGKIEEALQSAELTASIAMQYGVVFAEADALSTLAMIYARFGQIEKAEKYNQQFIKSVKDFKTRMYDNPIESMNCFIAFYKGDFETASVFINSLAQDSKQPTHIYEVLYMYKIIHHEYEWTIAHTTAKIAALESGQTHYMLPAIYLWRGQAFLGDGKYEEAFSDFNKSLAMLQEIRIPYILWQTHARLAEINRLMNRQNESKENLKKSAEYINYLAENMPADLRISFLNLPEIRDIIGGIL